jgi:hypothetical protein
MKTIVNVIVLVLTSFCLCIIAYVRLGIGFPVWHSENYQNYNIVFENLSYSYIAGVVVYVLTIVFPDFQEGRRIKPIVDMKIAHLAELFNKQLWGFGTSTGNAQQGGFYQPDCTNIDECISLMNQSNWNTVNPIVNTPRNRLYETFKQDLDTILLEIADILQAYKAHLSQSDIQHLENIRQNNYITLLNVLYTGNATFPTGSQKPIVDGHKKVLEEYNAILKERKILMN